MTERPVGPSMIANRAEEAARFPYLTLPEALCESLREAMETPLIDEPVDCQGVLGHELLMPDCGKGKGKVRVE